MAPDSEADWWQRGTTALLLVDHQQGTCGDTCQAETPERHQSALACFRGYAAQITVETFAATLTP